MKLFLKNEMEYGGMPNANVLISFGPYVPACIGNAFLFIIVEYVRASRIPNFRSY